jgi:hypothetical protein
MKNNKVVHEKFLLSNPSGLKLDNKVNRTAVYLPFEENFKADDEKQTK